MYIVYYASSVAPAVADRPGDTLSPPPSAPPSDATVCVSEESKCQERKNGIKVEGIGHQAA